MHRLAVLLFVTGLCIIVPGAVLLNAVTPGMDLLPDNYRQESVFQGTYRLLDSSGEDLVEHPVTLTRVREVTGVESPKAYVTETVSVTSPSPDFPESMAGTHLEFAINRATRLHMTRVELFMVADELPTGYMTFPPDVQRDVQYPIWFPDAIQAVPARFNGTVERDGLTLYAFVIRASGLRVWSDCQAHKARMADVVADYLVEPRSGLVVDERIQTTQYVDDDVQGWQVADVRTLDLTEESAKANMAKAKAERFRLVFIGSYVPWLIMGLGMLFSLYGILLAAVWWLRSRGRLA